MSTTFVSSTGYAIRHFAGPLVEAVAGQEDVAVVANLTGDQEYSASGLGDAIDVQHVKIVREPSPFLDLLAAIRLAKILRASRPDVVYSISPKGGLVGQLAAFIARREHRVHYFTGQVWATRDGLSRTLLRSIDRLIATLSTSVLADSPSQAQFLVDEGVVQPNKITVLGHGSVCGIDTSHFRPDPDLRSQERNKLGLDDSTVVVTLLGRITKDKGVFDLVDAMAQVTSKDVVCLFVGPDDGALPELEQRIAALENADRVRVLGSVPNALPILAASDIFCLPSHREGFGSSVLEASSMALPAIGTNIYGLIDAIEDGSTGLIVPVADPAALSSAIDKLAADPELRVRLGVAGRDRALSSFDRPVVIDHFLSFHEQLTSRPA